MISGSEELCCQRPPLNTEQSPMKERTPGRGCMLTLKGSAFFRKHILMFTALRTVSFATPPPCNKRSTKDMLGVIIIGDDRL